MSPLYAPIDLTATREYRELGFQIVNCPVCGAQTLDNHWICPHCGWEYDGPIGENEYSSCNQATVAKHRNRR